MRPDLSHDSEIIAILISVERDLLELLANGNSSDEEVSKDRNPKKARKSKSKYPTSKSGKGGHNHTTQGSCCGASQGSAHCDCSVWFIPSDDGRELKGDGRGGTEETGAGYLYVIG